MSVITLPAAIKASARRVRFTLIREQSNLSTITGVSQITSFPDRRWAAQVEIVPQYRDQLRLWSLAITRLSDIGNVFALGPPHYSGPSTGYSGTGPLVAGGAQLGKTLNVDGLGASVSVLNPGDFISFESTSVKNNTNRQLIPVASAVTSNGAGEATINLELPIRDSPDDNAPVEIVSPTAFFSLVRSQGGVEIVPGIWSAFMLDAVERIYP